jgi:hypothetical protein
MQRWAIRLALLAAVAGTPLRQAEAAADLARTLAEIGATAGAEPLDGRVGDEPEVATLKADLPELVAPEHVPMPGAPGVAPVPRAARRACVARPAPWTRPPWSRVPAARRHAWLQVFLF